MINYRDFFPRINDHECFAENPVTGVDDDEI